MSLYDKLKVRRQTQRAIARANRLEEEAKNKKETVIELSLVGQIKELAIDHDIKLSMSPLMIDEVSNEYDRRSTVHKLTVTEENVKTFRLLCQLTAQSNKYAAAIRYDQKATAPDYPHHIFPVLECSLVRADPSNPLYPIRIRSNNHPLYVIPKYNTQNSLGMSNMDSTLSAVQSGSQPNLQPQTSFNSSFVASSLSSSSSTKASIASATAAAASSSVSASDKSSVRSSRKGIMPLQRAPAPPPPQEPGYTNAKINASACAREIENAEQWLLYIRCTCGTREDNSSWGSLESSLREGRWVSEKLIVKWSLQLVKSLWQLHSKCFTFGSMYAKDISLVSDQTVIDVNNAKITYITKTEERGMAINLYNRDYKGVYLRSDAMIEKLDLERRELIKKKKMLEKQNSWRLGDEDEDEGDGVGGLMDSVPANSMFTSVNPDRGDSPPDRESMRKLFMISDKTERAELLESLNGSVKKKKRDKYKLIPEAANRKDAWLALPFAEAYPVQYVPSGFTPSINDDATSLDSGMFSHSTTSALEVQSIGDAPPPRPKKKHKSGSMIIGDNTNLQMEVRPKPTIVVAATAPSSNTPDVDKYTTPVIDEYEKKHKSVFHEDLAKRIPVLVRVPLLSRQVMPKKR